MEFKQATRQDLPAMTHLMSEAFAEYPTYTIPMRATFASRESYIAFLDRLNRLEIQSFIKQKAAYILIENAEIVGIALLEAPTFKESNLIDYVFNGGLQVVPGFWRHHLGQFLDIVKKTADRCQARRKQGSWYLKVLAISPKAQGKHLGSQLLEKWLVPYIREQKGHELCMITNTPANCRFYQKNHFELFDSQDIQLNQQTIKTWSFRRTLGESQDQV